MGVKRQWKIQKLSGLPIKEETRHQLITEIMRRKNPSIKVYAWDIHEGVASECFFKEKAATFNWYMQKRLWESDELPKGVLLYEWKISVDELLKHLKDGRILSVPVTESKKLSVDIAPSDFHKDIQQTSKKRV